MEKIPKVIWAKIFFELDKKEIAKIFRVSKTWKENADTDYFWIARIKKDLPWIQEREKMGVEKGGWKIFYKENKGEKWEINFVEQAKYGSHLAFHVKVISSKKLGDLLSAIPIQEFMKNKFNCSLKNFTLGVDSLKHESVGWFRMDRKTDVSVETKLWEESGMDTRIDKSGLHNGACLVFKAYVPPGYLD